MLDPAHQLMVALQLLQRRSTLDAEAVAAVLLQHHADADVAFALTRGLGLVCDAGAACAIAAVVSADRRAAAQAMLVEAGMADLLGEPSPLAP